MENAENKLPVHVVAAAGIVLNEKGEILLVKDRRSGWVFPGGMVEEGENVIDAVKREVMEETGIDIEVGEIFCMSSNTGKYAGYNGVKEVPTKLILDFICKATGGILRSSDENSDSAFFSEEKASALIQAPSVAERFRAYLEYPGRPTYLEYVIRPTFELKRKTTL